MDLVSAAAFGLESAVFVTLRRTGSVALNYLAIYDAGGKMLQEALLSMRGLLSGIAVDTITKTAFVADVWSSSIRRFELGSLDAGSELWLTLKGVEYLGPIAIDPQNRNLYAADVFAGDLYEISLDGSPSPQRIATLLGEPSAIAFDAATRKLYVADATDARIWEIAVDSASVESRVFSNDPQLDEPRGLAILDGSELWVGDKAARSLFKLSAAGDVEITVKAE